MLLHALFSRLDAKRCVSYFRYAPCMLPRPLVTLGSNCWPLLDRKSEASFRKLAGDWLADVAKVVASHAHALVSDSSETQEHPESEIEPNISKVLHALSGPACLY